LDPSSDVACLLSQLLQLLQYKAQTSSKSAKLTICYLCFDKFVPI
jgi:hypothetical protein